MECILVGKSCEMIYKEPHHLRHAWELYNVSDHGDVSDNENTAETSIRSLSDPALLKSSLASNAMPQALNKKGANGDRPTLVFRPSFIRMTSHENLYSEIRSPHDKGVFNLVKSNYWKVASIEHFEVKASTSSDEGSDDGDSEQFEAKEESTDHFGEENLACANCVFLVL